MKTAIIISGQPRNVEENFESIRVNILEPNGYPDVFIHSWINDEDIGKRYYSSWMKLDMMSPYHYECFKDMCNENGFIPTSDIVPANIRGRILDLYKPKTWCFEPQRVFGFDKKFYDIIGLDKEEIDRRIPNALSLYYSTYHANLLKQLYEIQNGFIYDFVLKIRFDLILRKPLILTEYDPNVLTHSDHHWTHNICFTNLWAFSSSRIMNVYSETYLHILDLIEKKTTFTDECLLGQHIHKNNIKRNPIQHPTGFLRIKGVEM